ncbi:ligand-gated channel protein [Serratia sp. TSA_7]|uniref:Ligand-gated channel protein n=1 Tax=Serratia plymuthica S13 TaxID=1348660 RepID=S4YL49_SERPL|nr:ligand-gated channel protein [Serratia plymuthica]AGP45246.1 ligand-gated channel protein [Serratia plymuthica S13]ANJ94979.1 outer membrane siderophore receptor [Serratia plymuthica]EKF63418.1 colicin I TonB-dependent receptor [Serratia plymuthica A30]KYG17939.1 Colicin I receptor precursor [Serratia plymuthica]NIC26236.1 ligand-gated channel protein [Serratia plymuthica]
MDKPRYNKLTALIIASLASTGTLAAQEDTQDTMVVTASGFQQKIQDSAASISVIPRQQIEDKAYRDITDALKDVPGVVVTGGASSSDISIRGMSSKYTLILVDGKRVDTRGTRPNSDNSGIEQGWLPPLEAIERIEVVRGPMSSLYGSDAMGGVINVITRKTSRTEWKGSLHGDATFQERSDSGDIFQTNAYASGPLIEGLLGLRVNGLLSRRAEDKIVNGYNEQRMRSGTAVFSLTPDDKNEFDFEVGRSLQDRNSTPGESVVAERCSKGKCTPSTRSESLYTRTNYALTHNGYYDFGNTTSYIQREETNNPGRDMKMYNTIFNTQNQFELGSHMLNLGGQYRYEKLGDSGNKLESAQGLNQLTRWSWALFAEDEWALTNDFSLTSGIRMDQDQNYGNHWTPRMYGVWHLTEQWTLKGGVSAGYRSPDLRQSSASWGQVTGGGVRKGIIVGNPDLQPEKSLSEEIGLMWDNQQNLNAGVTVFNTDFKDKITEVRRCEDTPDCTIGGDLYDFISDRTNVDKANMRGVEATFGWQISKEWKWNTNYTFTSSEQKSGEFQGKALNQMPKHMVNTVLDWQATHDVSLWSRVNFRSKTSEYLSRTSMAKSTPSYTFVDAGLSYQANKDLTVTGGIYNILDKTVDYDNYNTTLDGRRYTVGMTYNF